MERPRTPGAEVPIPESQLDQATTRRWLTSCLPVFVQPQVDIDCGYPLVKVYYSFYKSQSRAHVIGKRRPTLSQYVEAYDGPQDVVGAHRPAEGPEHALSCKLIFVFAGEGSFSRAKPSHHNGLATLFYRTFNRTTFDRTADLNYLEYRGVNLKDQSWQEIFTTDHHGPQTWSQGSKRDIGWWFSLMHHYRRHVPLESWQRDGSRPLIYVNTCNHMIGERDANPTLAKHRWYRFAIEEGTQEDAERFAKDFIPTKFNLYSLFCFWRAKNGGSFADGCLD